MSTSEVTTAMFTHGEVDEKKYAAFVARLVKAYQRARDRAARANNMRSDYFGWTDADCVRCAETYCGMYKHQFRVLVQVDAKTWRAPVAA